VAPRPLVVGFVARYGGAVPGLSRNATGRVSGG